MLKICKGRMLHLAKCSDCSQLESDVEAIKEWIDKHDFPVPTEDGEYILHVTVADGEATYGWVKEPDIAVVGTAIVDKSVVG